MTTGIPLSQAIAEYLSWLELDRGRSRRTVAEYQADLGRFAAFAGGDVGVPDVAGLGRDCRRALRARGGRWRSPRAHGGSSRCAASCALPPGRNGSPATWARG